MSKENGTDLSSPFEMVGNISFQARNLAEVVEQAHQQIHKIEKENKNAIENIQINILNSKQIKQESEVDLDLYGGSRRHSHSNKSGLTETERETCPLSGDVYKSSSEEAKPDFGESTAGTTAGNSNESTKQQSTNQSKTVVQVLGLDKVNSLVIKEEYDLDNEPRYSEPFTFINGSPTFDPNTLIGQPKLLFNSNVKFEPVIGTGIKKENRNYRVIRPRPAEIPEIDSVKFKTENVVPKIENMSAHYDKEAEEIYEKERTQFFLCNTCSEAKNRKIIFFDGLKLSQHVTAVHHMSPQTTGPHFQFTAYGESTKYHCFAVVQEVVFLCKYRNCPKRYTNEELLQIHIDTCHNGEDETSSHQCQYKLCSRRFPNQDKRRQHVQTFHVEHSINFQDCYGALWVIKKLPYTSAYTDTYSDFTQIDIFREIQRFFSLSYQLETIVFTPSEDFESTLNESDSISSNMLPIVDPNDVELQRFEKICSVTCIFEEIKKSDVDFLVDINNINSRMLKGGVTIHNADSDCVYFIDDIEDFKEDQSDTFTPIIKDLKPKDVEMDIGDLVFLYGKPDPNYSGSEQDNFLNPIEEDIRNSDATSAVDDNEDTSSQEKSEMVVRNITDREDEDKDSIADTDCQIVKDDTTNNPITISLEPFGKSCHLNERIGTFEKPDSVGKEVCLNVNTEALKHEALSSEKGEVQIQGQDSKSDVESEGQGIKSEVQSQGQEIKLEHHEGYTTLPRRKKFKTHNRFKKPPILDFSEKANVYEEIKVESSLDNNESKSTVSRKKSSESNDQSDMNVHTWNEEEIGSCISIPECRIKNIIGHIRKSQEEMRKSENSPQTNTELEISAKLESETASLNEDSENSLQNNASYTKSFSDNLDVDHIENGSSSMSISDIKTENDIVEYYTPTENEGTGQNLTVQNVLSDVHIKTENDIDEYQIDEMLDYENVSKSHFYSDENFGASHEQTDDNLVEDCQSNELIEKSNIFYNDINNLNDQIAEKLDMSCDQKNSILQKENEKQSFKMAADLNRDKDDITHVHDHVTDDLKGQGQKPVKNLSHSLKHRTDTTVKKWKVKLLDNHNTKNGAIKTNIASHGVSGHIGKSHQLKVCDKEESFNNTVKLCDKTVPCKKLENKISKESSVDFSDNMKKAKCDNSLKLNDKSVCRWISKEIDIRNTDHSKESALSVQTVKEFKSEPFTQSEKLSNGAELHQDDHQRFTLLTSLAENVKINRRQTEKDLKQSESTEFEKDRSEVRNSNKNTRDILFQKQKSKRRKIRPLQTTIVINGIEVKKCEIKVFKLDKDDVEYICKELKLGHKTDYANYLYSMQKMDARSYDQLVNGDIKLNMKHGKFKRVLQVCQNLFKTKKDLIDNLKNGVSDNRKRKSLSLRNLKSKKRKMNNEADSDWLVEFDDSSSASEDHDEDELDGYDLDESDVDFICPEPDCGRSFPNEEKLDRHLSRAHEDNMYPTSTERKFCPIENCDKSYSSKGNLMSHIRRDHGEDAYKEIRIELYGSKIEEKKAPVDQPTVIRPAGTCLMPTIWRKPQPLIPPHVKEKITKTSQTEQPKNVKEVEDIKNILSEFTQNGRGSFYSILSNK